MRLTRREALALGAAAAAFAALPGAGWAAEDVQAAVDAFTGGAEATEGGIDLNTPEIAENGNTVPVDVSAEGASAIMILATGNPRPEVATFNFGPLSAKSAASTRIRLAKTQEVIALAKMKDGSFAKTSKTVKVTIGGCGG